MLILGSLKRVWWGSRFFRNVLDLYSSKKYFRWWIRITTWDGWLINRIMVYMKIYIFFKTRINKKNVKKIWTFLWAKSNWNITYFNLRIIYGKNARTQKRQRNKSDLHAKPTFYQFNRSEQKQEMLQSKILLETFLVSTYLAEILSFAWAKSFISAKRSFTRYPNSPKNISDLGSLIKHFIW